MWNENYRWHFDYIRLACDAGFTFSTLKSSVSLEKSNIGILDVEQVIKSRDVGIVERFIPVITQFKLDPEQSQILDANFIKLFMVAQLAIEYLNFCKMYLDNTVVLLKKELNKIKEDRDTLRNCCADLKSNISHLKKKSKEMEPIAAYKCENCTKVFSSEEFLLSHIKRRHENQAYQAETDKLQLEIKELKERLNNTEKTVNNDLLSKEKVEFVSKDFVECGSGTKINELQQKFEILKTHVESELKLLQTQKSFQDKYERWFEVAFNNLMVPQNPGTPIKTVEVKATQHELSGELIKEMEKRDCAIQTRQMSPTIVTRVHQIKSSPTSRRASVDFVEVQEKLSAETKEQVSKIEKVLEKKITGSMERIENQMSSFWTKLNEIEQQKLIVNEPSKQILNVKGDLNIEISSEQSSPIEMPQLVKPTRFNNVEVEKKKNKSDVGQTNISKNYTKDKNASKNISDESSITSLEEVDFQKEPPVLRPPSKESTKTIFVMNPKPKPRQSIKKQFSKPTTSPKIEFVETSEETASEEAIVVKPSNTSTLARRSVTSLKQLVADPKLIKELEGEVEIVLNKHLEEMGVSPQWKGIPERTFEQTMRVVKHQAALAKKNYPHYQTLREQLIKTLQAKLKKPKKHKKPPSKMSFSGNLKKINYVPVVETKTEVFKVESKIKTSENTKTSKTPYRSDTKKSMYGGGDGAKTRKSMYGSDDESAHEVKVQQPPKTQVGEAFKSVIQELKEVHQETLQQEETNKNETKSALKNYPSVGSLTRKKVLFDLDSDDNKQGDVQQLTVIKPVESGSTTSIASSVLDGSKVNLSLEDDNSNKPDKETSKDKDSDWDVSDLLS